MASRHPLDLYRCPDHAHPMRVSDLASVHPASQRLDLLRRPEPAPSVLELSTGNLAPHAVHPQPCMPAPHAALDQCRGHLTTPMILVFVLPSNASTIAAPTTLYLNGRPELLLSANCLSPKLQAAHAATHVALDSDHRVLIRRKLLVELPVLPPHPCSKPHLPDEGRGPLHVPVPDLPQTVDHSPRPPGAHDVLEPRSRAVLELGLQ
mmetsp:Transcript_66606/g.184428  ORF Transcript_66606/g.184428 Transcript_66606/m.184428 type:complete len:207 (-) Transcript_66606:1908-2528(-)